MKLFLFVHIYTHIIHRPSILQSFCKKTLKKEEDKRKKRKRKKKKEKEKRKKL